MKKTSLLRHKNLPILNKNMSILLQLLFGLGVSLNSAIAGEKQIYLSKHLISQTNIPVTDTPGNIPQLNRYEYENLFTTYFPPEKFLVEKRAIHGEKTVRFMGKFQGKKLENAYIQITFPKFSTLRQMRSFINAKPGGLISSHGWRIVARIRDVPYSWGKEKIVFSRSKDIVGEIYIGESQGKAFYVISHFPVEYGDEFVPGTNAILQHLAIAMGGEKNSKSL